MDDNQKIKITLIKTSQAKNIIYRNVLKDMTAIVYFAYPYKDLHFLNTKLVRGGGVCHILEAKIRRPNILKTKKLCKGEKMFLRSSFCSTSNMKAFLGFLYTGCININIMSMKNYNNKLNMV